METYYIGPDGHFYRKTPNPFDMLSVTFTGTDTAGQSVVETVRLNLSPRLAALRYVDLAVYVSALEHITTLHLGTLDLVGDR